MATGGVADLDEKYGDKRRAQKAKRAAYV